MQCALFNFYYYSYNFIDHSTVPTKISFFYFCRPSDRNIWNNIIKRREYKDGFKIRKPTWGCEKLFPPAKIYSPSGGTWKRSIQETRPFLHYWKNFTSFQKYWKEPLRRSPRKNAKVPDCSDSEQQDDVQEDLFYTDNKFTLMIHQQILKKQPRVLPIKHLRLAALIKLTL